MHLVDVEHGFLGATGVVGGNVPLALGSALAGRLLRRRPGGGRLLRRRRRAGRHLRGVGEPRDALGLPVILVCENNGFAEFTPRSAHTNVERVRTSYAPRLDRARRSTATTSGRPRSVCRLPRRGAQREGRFLLECLTTACAATTRATRSSTARRSRQTSGRARSDRAPQRRGGEGWLLERTPARLERGARATRSRRRSLSRGRARCRPRAGGRARSAS